MTNIRAKKPKIYKKFHPELPAVNTESLDNGMELHTLQGGTEPVMKLEIIFFAGRPYEHRQQVSRMTCQMLFEGTRNMDGKTLSAHFDYYGSNITPYLSMDHSGLTLYCLEKHAGMLLPVLIDMLQVPAFDPGEFAKLQNNAIEKLQLDLSKNDFVAYRELTAALYGPQHYYGYNSIKETIATLTIEDLHHHFKSAYSGANALAFLSGRLQQETVDMVKKSLSTLPSGRRLSPKPSPEFTPLTNAHYFPSSNKHQVALRMGRKLFPRNHPDFDAMYILNAILGGYFGSRLMTQIREEEGFTYNIYSSIENMQFDGALIIAMDTDEAFLEESIKSIRRELRNLMEKPVKKAELNMVKTYLLGYMLTALDGPLSQAELIRNLILEDSGLQSFDQFIDKVNTINPEELQELAIKYLDPDDMVRIVVGAKS
jgi:zinc protease